MYGSIGMAPPSLYEELHYAEKLCETLGFNDSAAALWDRIERAKKWDYGSIYDIRDLFQKGYIYLAGDAVLFREKFGRDGVCPYHQDVEERDYPYIHRWNQSMNYNRLSRLPLLQQEAVIKNSAGNMDYYGMTLVVDLNRFHPDYHKPETVLWQLAKDESTTGKEPEYFVNNKITGNTGTIFSTDVLGVLRPDIEARIDFPALQSEYAAAQEASSAEKSIDDEENEI